MDRPHSLGHYLIESDYLFFSHIVGRDDVCSPLQGAAIHFFAPVEFVEKADLGKERLPPVLKIPNRADIRNIQNLTHPGLEIADQVQVCCGDIWVILVIPGWRPGQKLGLMKREPRQFDVVQMTRLLRLISDQIERVLSLVENAVDGFEDLLDVSKPSTNLR